MTPTEFCQVVENRLGWAPPTDLPPWKQYMPSAKAVARKIATNRQLYTWENLLLAVELLAREKEPRSPIGVFAHVERAVERAREVDTDLELLIQHALSVESAKGDPNGWVTRFARATGAYRQEAYDEWLMQRWGLS